MVKRHGAQLVFMQESEHQWIGILLSHDAIDSTYNLPALRNGQRQYRCIIRENDNQSRAELETCGPHAGGTRYRTFYTHGDDDALTRAQETAAAWARRRFYIEAQ